MEEEIQNDDLLPEEGLLEAPGEQNDLKTRILKWVSVFFLGLITFVFGLFLFFPLDTLSQVYLQQAAQKGVPLEVGESQISKSGSFNFTQISYTLPGAEPEKNSVIGAVYLEGEVSPVDFFMKDRLMLTGMMTGVQVVVGDALLSGGDWNFNVELDNFCDGMFLPEKGETSICDIMKFTGEVKLTAKNVMVKYQQISSEILSLEIKGKVKNGSFNFDVSTLKSELADVILQGSIIFTGSGNANMGLVVIPGQSAYDHEQLGGMLELAKAQGYIQPDGKMEIRISGPFKKLNYSFSAR